MKHIDKEAAKRWREQLKNIAEQADLGLLQQQGTDEDIIARARKDPAFFNKFFFPHYATAEPAHFHIRLAKKAKKHKELMELVRWGRGLAKSVWVNVIIPLWLWINDEKVFMVIAGNNADKAAILLDDVRAEFEANAHLRYYFGAQKQEGSWRTGDFSTKDGRFIGLSIGMGQSPLGLRKGPLRPNYISCDDLEDQETRKNPKTQDDVVYWIENDLIPTMDGDTQRYFHPNNDPWERSIQNLLEVLHPDWGLDVVEAYNETTYEPAWKSKYSKDYYKKQERKLGAINARAQYNHKKHVKGKVFTDELILWQKMPHLDHMRFIVGFWDVAYSGKNDYNAVKVWGLHDGHFWHIKAFVRQCKMEEAIRFMYAHEATLPPTVVVHWRVESQFWNDPVKDALKTVAKEKGRPLNIVTVDRPRTKKYDRLISMHPYYQNGKPRYNEKERADPDMQVGINQLKGIEPGYRTHDDGPDADEQAMAILAAHEREGAFEPRLTTFKELRRKYSRNSF